MIENNFERMLRYFTVAFFISSIACTLCSQDLVLNGNFEELTLYKNNYTIDGQLVFMEAPDTTKMWHLVRKEHINVNSKYWNRGKNFINNTYYSSLGYARSGKVYGEIKYTYFRGTIYNTYSIKHQLGRLCQPLVKGNRYRLEFYIKPFSGNYFPNAVDIQFSKLDTFNLYNEVSYKKRKNYRKEEIVIHPDIITVPLKKDTQSYQKIVVEYTSKGEEEFFVIGNLYQRIPNFRPVKKLEPYGHNYERIKTHRYSFASYIVDDFEMISLSDENETCPIETVVEIEKDTINFTQTNIEKNKGDDSYSISSTRQKIITINELNFKENEFHIEDSILRDLVNRVIKFNPKKIEIIGHTDSEGTEDYNLELSLKRATFIRDMLAPDFPKTEFKIKGFGESQPLVIEKDEESKRQNRRVELILYD